jgi:hypothetical protein
VQYLFRDLQPVLVALHVTISSMKKASTILLWACLSSIVANFMLRAGGGETVLTDVLEIVGIGLLCWGAVAWERERKAMKRGTSAQAN